MSGLLLDPIHDRLERLRRQAREEEARLHGMHGWVLGRDARVTSVGKFFNVAAGAELGIVLVGDLLKDDWWQSHAQEGTGCPGPNSNGCYDLNSREEMRDTPYYAVRKGLRSPKIDFNVLKGLFLAAFDELSRSGYFQQVLGIHCVDGYLPGLAGENIEVFFFRKLKKRNIWPFEAQSGFWEEEDLFDVIEVLHDCASKGVDGHYHSYCNCGMHYETFDAPAGQNDFRVAINEVLREYGDGYAISVKGEIFAGGPRGLRDLTKAAKPPGDPANVQNRVEAAIDKFQNRASNISDRRDAIRELAAILEFLRPQVKAVLERQDEADLFRIANNFGIRHHNQLQKTVYDETIWLSWMFYFFLASIHAATRLIEKEARNKGLRPHGG